MTAYSPATGDLVKRNPRPAMPLPHPAANPASVVMRTHITRARCVHGVTSQSPGTMFILLKFLRPLVIISCCRADDGNHSTPNGQESGEDTANIKTLECPPVDNEFRIRTACPLAPHQSRGYAWPILSAML
ncbi:hypothetical protein EVAR_22307_1 [Eumeta japonica]|uniref:Uncharacterized protein n=1 Tax=Eumeta variegata TaxID=151549 RepID=A0A4C1UBF6_EUMVA|nr:hypothetical protein EVAR_22307_1 [Eumeta japonica]